MIVRSAGPDDLVAIWAPRRRRTIAPDRVAADRSAGDVRISARLFRQSRTPLLIVRIERADATIAGHQFDTALSDVVERMPDSFVLVDRDLNVLTANGAFIEIAEMPSIERVTGAALGTWLGRRGSISN